MSDNEVNIEADIEKISRILIVPSLLDVICRTTGMGFSAIARVTEDKWVTCSTQDEINFGLKPGDELKVETTICHEIRESHKPVIIDHVEKDENYCAHHTPALYGFQSYISVPIFRKDNSFFGTLCAIDPKPAKLNKPETIGMFTLFADLISFHLKTLEELDDTETKLLEERQTAELREQFIAILGHDLRNPLASTIMGVEVLLQRPLDKDTSRVVGAIKKATFRMKGLVENMLDFARGRLGGGITLNLETHTDSLENTLLGVISEIRSVSPSRAIETSFNIDEPVVCDQDRIAQLFSNLLGNAITHGATDKPVFIRATSLDGEFKLSVTNTGDKIPDIVMNNLFQPFSREKTKSGKQGLGLGLYIASEIARAHGGVVDVNSSDEETSFTFKMPSAN